MIAASSEQELNALFDVLPVTHPAKAPYSIFKQASESVRGGVIIGLGSRLQVFQNRDIRNITSYNEIDLELPGKQPCAYYCITSDQDSTFDFLSSLFLSFVFIAGRILTGTLDGVEQTPSGRMSPRRNITEPLLRKAWTASLIPWFTPEVRSSP